MGTDSEKVNNQSAGQGNWDNMYAGIEKSKMFLRIYRDVYGDDYAEGVEQLGPVTKTDLIRIAHFLSINSGKTFIDLGCGRGGPGLWVARETGADLIGIDLSPIGVEQAKRRVSDFGLEGHARFFVADFCATGLQDKSCDGAISIDTLFFVPNQTAAVSEVARILRSGARFVFTTVEKLDKDTLTDRELYGDNRLLLLDSGFVVEEYHEMLDWGRYRAVLERWLAEQATLIKEMGDTAARLFINAAKEVPGTLATLRRLFIVCRKI